MSALESINPTATEVVAKALINTKKELGLTNEVLGNIIGMDSSTVSRLIKRKNMKSGKVMETGLLLIRVYRSLYAILGGNHEAMKHWLNIENSHLQGKPLDRLQEITGLVHIVTYLDAMRGRA